MSAATVGDYRYFGSDSTLVSMGRPVMRLIRNYRTVRNGLAVHVLGLVCLSVWGLVSCRQVAANRSGLANDESGEELSLAELEQAANEWSSLSAVDLQNLSQQLAQLPLISASTADIGKSVKMDGEKLILAQEVVQVNQVQMQRLQQMHPSTGAYWKAIGFSPTKVSPDKIRTSIDILVKYLRSDAQLKQHTPPKKTADSEQNKLGLLGYVSTTIEGFKALGGMKNNAEEATKRSNWQALVEARPTLDFTANVLAKLPGAASQRIAVKLRVLNRIAPVINNSFEASDLMPTTVNDWSH